MRAKCVKNDTARGAVGEGGIHIRSVLHKRANTLDVTIVTNTKKSSHALAGRVHALGTSGCEQKRLQRLVGTRSIRCRRSHLHLFTAHAAAHMRSVSDRTNSNTACTFVVSFTECRVPSAPTHSLCVAE
jgi:hypothetical protein